MFDLLERIDVVAASGLVPSSDLPSKLLTAQIGGNNVIKITPPELAQLLQCFDRTHCPSGMLTTKTEPRWKGGKKNPVVLAIGGTIYKISRYSCGIGNYYKTRVDNKGGKQLDIRPDYQPLPRNGMHFVGGSALLQADKTPTQFYVPACPNNFAVETQFVDDCGNELPHDTLTKEQYKWEGVSRQERETRIDSPVPLRSPKVENVILLELHSLRIEGKFQSVNMTFSIEG